MKKHKEMKGSVCGDNDISSDTSGGMLESHMAPDVKTHLWK